MTTKIILKEEMFQRKKLKNNNEEDAVDLCECQEKQNTVDFVTSFNDVSLEASTFFRVLSHFNRAAATNARKNE